jgi:hypothetical protein
VLQIVNASALCTDTVRSNRQASFKKKGQHLFQKVCKQPVCRRTRDIKNEKGLASEKKELCTLNYSNG